MSSRGPTSGEFSRGISHDKFFSANARPVELYGAEVSAK